MKTAVFLLPGFVLFSTLLYCCMFASVIKMKSFYFHCSPAKLWPFFSRKICFVCFVYSVRHQSIASALPFRRVFH